jgi:hypothetical protein
MGENRNAHKGLVKSPEATRVTRKPKYTWKIILK